MKKTTGKAKKGLVMLLCTSMVISVTPMSAMAEEMTTEEALTSESAGTEETDAEESFISEELTTEEEETGEQGNEEGIQFEDGDTEETWITEEADTDQLAEAESFIGESDIDLYAMTEDMPIEDGASVYVLTEKDGAYYDAQGIKYTLSTDGNTATVSGYNKTTIASKYTDQMVAAGNGWEIMIPAKVKSGDTEYAVTEIGDYAFEECTKLTKVDFVSNSVLTRIGDWAFYACSSLKQINLPVSLITIGQGPFSNTKLSSIFIPKNVSYIDSYICGGCSQLVEIKVDPDNTTYNVGYGNINCIIRGTTILQGCQNSIIPNKVTRLGDFSFEGMDIRKVDFSGCSGVYSGNGAFARSILPEDWKIPECFLTLDLAGNTSLKRVTFHDESLNLNVSSEFYSIFPRCSNIEEAVIPDSTRVDPSGWNIEKYDVFGDGGGAENLTVYVGDFSEDNVLFQSLKAHAYKDYTGDKVVTYEKTDARHYVLKKAYKVQFDQEYEGYTLAKAKGCTTLTPIPGDSVRFVINCADGYKKTVKVYVTDDNGNKTKLTPDENGVYTLNNVNENNYKICLEGNGVCNHSVNTYTLENSTITKVCNDCGGNVEIGNVTAVWRHTPYTSVVFSCDNANIKGTFAITEDITSGKDKYSYKFTPTDGTCSKNGTITVVAQSEDEENTTANGITYSTVQSETDINKKIGNCTADIYYDSDNSILHIDGSETYVISGKSTADRIVVNNTEPVTIILNGLDIQMTNLPTIDLQGIAEVKIVLADGTENTLTATGDYAALQRNNFAENTPKLIINGPGNLTATATGYGAAIGAEKNKYASNIIFNNAQITANSSDGSAIGNGNGAKLDNSKLGTDNFIISGGVVRATVNSNSYDISGGVTVTEDAVVYGVVWGRAGITKLKDYTIIDGSGFISRREVGRDSYSKCQGNIIVDDIFSCNDLEIPEGSTLTVGFNHGQMLLRLGKNMTNNGTLIIKGYENNFDGQIINNGTIYNYEKTGHSIKNKITNSDTGTLHEDVDHDGKCEICGQDIGNVIVDYTDKTDKVTAKQNGSFNLSATVTPKDTVPDKTITYQWYKQDSDNSYTKIDGATTSTYTEKNSTLAVGTYNYRLKAVCDGIIRYIPFTVTVKVQPTIIWTETDQTVVYTGNEIDAAKITAPTVTLPDGTTLDGNITYSYRKLTDGTTADSFTSGLPTDIGTYEIKAAVSEDENYAAAETDTYMKLTVKKAQTIVNVSSNPANSGILTGGGTYEAGERIILSAKAVDGYTFDGWYSADDQKLSGETTYEYGTAADDASSETTIYAKYKTNESRQLSMTLGNGKVEYSYQNGTKTGTWGNDFTNNNFARGTYFTVTAKPNEGYTFLYWINSDGRVLTDSLTYSFYLGDNMGLRACYKSTQGSETENAKHYVIFKDMSGRILWSGDVSMDQGADSGKYGQVKAPKYSIFTGYTFKQWKDASGNVIETDDDGNIKITNDITIYAEYEAISGLKLTVDGVESNKTYTYGSLVKVSADESRDNKYFSGWYIGDTLVSDKQEYSFYITENTEITAKYEGAEVITQKPLVNMTVGSRAAASNNEQTVPLNVTWSVPEGYEFMEAGLIRSNDGVVRDKDTFITQVDGTNVRRYVSKLMTSEGVYIYTLRLASDKTVNNVYAVGYITFKNIATGEVTTTYTDIVTSEASND